MIGDIFVIDGVGHALDFSDANVVAGVPEATIQGFRAFGYSVFVEGVESREPGYRLTPEEYAEIKNHPEIGAKILEPVDFLRDVAPCVRHHHEWYDGSERGYPLRLRGDQIPLAARVILVADTIEAMTSDRPYRNALPLEVVFTELTKYSGSQFDPSCVDAAVRLLADEGEDFIRKDQQFDIYAFLEA